jgi:hypothetical protein
MKIGDLVKYDKSLSGLEECLGIIVAHNGPEAFDVRWNDRHSKLQDITANEISTELKEFLEVASENR